MQILLVEDDVRLADALAQILSDSGYHVDAVHTGTDGLRYAEQGAYDVVILDVMLPGMNGFDVVASMRRAKIATPVLMLTARDQMPDKIRGFDSGADDYMTKPFAPAELLAHLRALTRRQGEVVFEELQVGNLVLNLETNDFECEGRTIHLSMKEFELARVLMSNSNQVLSKETLIEKVWGYGAAVEGNNVEAYVSFLRKKIRYVGAAVRLEAVRGRGYRMVREEGDEQ